METFYKAERVLQNQKLLTSSEVELMETLFFGGVVLQKFVDLLTSSEVELMETSQYLQADH